MPQSLSEFMNGGLVTARHPALLRAGELQRADDCVYREKDPAVWRAPGRTQYGTVVSSVPTFGLAYLPFENKFSPKIVAYSGATLYHLPVADTGTEVSTEMGGPLAVTGTIATGSGQSVFTADSSAKPFLSAIVGARIFSTTLNGQNLQTAVVSAISGTPTGDHYPGVVLRNTDGSALTSIFTNALATTIAFQYGCVQTLPQSATARYNTLEAAQYGASYFSWFGFGEPRKIEWIQPPVVNGVGSNPVLSQRPLGLAPVTDAITVAAISGTIGTSTDSYAWRTSLGTGYFWFLVTEIYVAQTVGDDGKARDLPGTEIESMYLGKAATSPIAGEPIAVLIPNLTTGARVVLPAVRNIGLGGRIATHWGIYMCPTPTTDAATRPSFAAFRRIARPAIKTYAAGTNTYGDAGTFEVFELAITQSIFATSVAAATGGINWENASAMTGAPNGGIGEDQTRYARGVSNSSVSAFGAVTPTSKLSYTIDATGAWANREVTGIGITIFGRANSSGSNQTHADVYLYPATATKNGAPRLAQFTNQTWSQVKSFGGPGDTWGVSWGVGSTLATFGVIVGVGGNEADMAAWVDAVGLTIFGSSATIDVNGKPYRVVVYRDQIGTTLAEPAYGLPPSCSTGDFFQGSLVTNDLEDETALRFSLPGSPEYFPRPYVMRLNATRRRDKITCIRTLGTVMLVGLENSIERVNYLPRETSTDLTDGLAHEELATDHGIPGPLAAVKFDMPEQGTLLAYVSSAGVFITNGVWMRPLNMDLDWPNTVKLSALDTCSFRVYPREKWLVLYYCPAGATHDKNTRALIFSYAADKIKEGGYLPCTGPVIVSARAACEVILSGGTRSITAHESSGLLYNEDTGTTIPSGYQVRLTDDSANGDGKTTASVDVKILPLIRTRKMFPAGIEKDAREERIYVLFSAYGATVTATPTTGGAVINTQTKDDTTIQSDAAVFGSVVAGMRVVGTGIDPGTIVISVAGNGKSIVLSRAVNTTAAGGVILTFDSGTLAITVRGSSIGEAVSLLDTSYGSTLTGDLIVVHNDNTKQGLELQFEKVVLPNASSVDLGVNMRLHQFTILLNDEGAEQNRSVA